MFAQSPGHRLAAPSGRRRLQWEQKRGLEKDVITGAEGAREETSSDRTCISARGKRWLIAGKVNVRAVLENKGVGVHVLVGKAPERVGRRREQVRPAQRILEDAQPRLLRRVAVDVIDALARRAKNTAEERRGRSSLEAREGGDGGAMT